MKYLFGNDTIVAIFQIDDWLENLMEEEKDSEIKYRKMSYKYARAF